VKQTKVLGKSLPQGRLCAYSVSAIVAACKGGVALEPRPMGLQGFIFRRDLISTPRQRRDVVVFVGVWHSSLRREYSVVGHGLSHDDDPLLRQSRGSELFRRFVLAVMEGTGTATQASLAKYYRTARSSYYYYVPLLPHPAPVILPLTPCMMADRR
jgi:hypothetical protein